MFRRYPPGRTRDLGRVFIGLGLLLISLHSLVDLFAPFQNAPLLNILLQALGTQPVAAMLVAAALTWAAHSSVAVVVLLMSMASHTSWSRRTRPTRWCWAPTWARPSTP